MLSDIRHEPTTSTLIRADKCPLKSYRIYNLLGKRVLALPEGSRRLVLIGWNCYRPFTFQRALIQRFMQLSELLCIGSVFCEVSPFPLGPDDEFRFGAWFEKVCDDINSPNSRPVIVWPPQKDRGRVYIHLINSAGRPVGFAKVSFDDCNDEQLRKEALVLRTLQSRRLKTYYVPGVLVEGFWHGHRYVVQEPLPIDAKTVSVTSSTFPRECVEELGGSTRIAEQDEIELLPWWRSFIDRSNGSLQPFVDELTKLIGSEGGLAVRRVHGDFGSANLARAEGQLWVLDWEESIENGPILADEIGYDLAAHAKTLRKRPKRELHRFSVQYLSNASPADRRDVMAALAFRYSIRPSDVRMYIENWSSINDSYRGKFVESTKPKEYEEQYAEGSYGDILWKIERRQLIDFLSEFRQNHSQIKYLDFAAGTGRLISFLEKHVDSAVGIEVSPAMVEIARKKLQHGRMLCTDITIPDTPVEGRYDLITAFRFFLNADLHLRRAAMKSLALRLKDETSRIVFNNHGNLWSHKLGMWPFHMLRRIGQGYISEGNYMTLSQANRLANGAGLVIEKVMGCGVFGPKAQWIIPFKRLLDIETRLGETGFASYFGVNQMYVARLKTTFKS